MGAEISFSRLAVVTVIMPPAIADLVTVNTSALRSPAHIERAMGNADMRRRFLQNDSAFFLRPGSILDQAIPQLADLFNPLGQRIVLDEIIVSAKRQQNAQERNDIVRHPSTVPGKNLFVAKAYDR